MSRPYPPPPDQPEWDAAATKWALGSIERIRGSAEKWVGTISALVGVFATVVVFAGPSTLADIEPTWARIAVFVTLGAAAIAAGAAILFGALAAQGISRIQDNWNGATFRAYTLGEGNAAARKLEWSRWLGSAAAALVLIAGLTGIALTLGDATTAKTNVIAVTETQTLCGPVTTGSDGTASVAGQTLEGAANFTVVDNCGAD